MREALRALGHPYSLRAALVRRLVRRLPFFDYLYRLSLNAVDRPWYGHCIFEAAQLASRLGYPKISVIEFGCGGGNGLINAEWHIAQVAQRVPVEIELYGFDTGSGLPPGQDYRDLVHYFSVGQFKMDVPQVRNRLKRGKLVLGDVRDTCARFFSDHQAAPVGCIFHDMDFYSSTRDALTLFDAAPQHFLPRVFMYFDDVIGNNTWLANEYVGEELAIDEFNRDHESKKITANKYMRLQYPDQWWTHQIYNYHDFSHPDYTRFVGAPEQIHHERDIRIR